MKSISIELLVTLLFSLLTQVCEASFRPQEWTATADILPQLKTKFGTVHDSEIVSVAGTESTIVKAVKDCLTKDGYPVNWYDCSLSVLSSAATVALSVGQYKETSTWSKRDTTFADGVLSAFPDHAKITDIKILGEPLPSNSSSPSVRRRDLHASDDPINVAYNGSLPLTFILHHNLETRAANLNSTTAAKHNITSIPPPPPTTHVPLFVATDGHTFSFNHISKPTNNSTLLSKSKRGPVVDATLNDDFHHLGAGGVKVQINSDPVANWDDIVEWLKPGQPDSPSYYLLAAALDSIWVGHSFKSWALDSNGRGYNAQFVMEGETVPFSKGWEVGWNYCFGVHKTNCN